MTVSSADRHHVVEIAAGKLSWPLVFCPIPAGAIAPQRQTMLKARTDRHGIGQISWHSSARNRSDPKKRRLAGGEAKAKINATSPTSTLMMISSLADRGLLMANHHTPDRRALGFHANQAFYNRPHWRFNRNPASSVSRNTRQRAGTKFHSFNLGIPTTLQRTK